MTETSDIIAWAQTLMVKTQARIRADLEAVGSPVSSQPASTLPMDYMVHGNDGARVEWVFRPTWVLPRLLMSGPGDYSSTAPSAPSAPGGTNGSGGGDSNLTQVLLFLDEAHRDLLNGNIRGYLQLLKALPLEGTPIVHWANSVSTWTEGRVQTLDVRHAPQIKERILHHLRGVEQDRASYDTIALQAQNDEGFLMAMGEIALRFDNRPIAEALSQVAVSDYRDRVRANPYVACAVALAGLYGNRGSFTLLDNHRIVLQGINNDGHVSPFPERLAALNFFQEYLPTLPPSPSVFTKINIPSFVAHRAEVLNNNLQYGVMAYYLQVLDGSSVDLFRQALSSDVVFLSYFLYTLQRAGNPHIESFRELVIAQLDQGRITDSLPIRYHRAQLAHYFTPPDQRLNHLLAEAVAGNHYALRILIQEARPYAIAQIHEQPVASEGTRLLAALRQLDLTAYPRVLRTLPITERFETAMMLHELGALFANRNVTDQVVNRISQDEREAHFLTSGWENAMAREMRLHDIYYQYDLYIHEDHREIAMAIADILIGEQIMETGQILVDPEVIRAQQGPLVRLHENDFQEFQRRLSSARRQLIIYHLEPIRSHLGLAPTDYQHDLLRELENFPTVRFSLGDVFPKILSRSPGLEARFELRAQPLRTEWIYAAGGHPVDPAQIDYLLRHRDGPRTTHIFPDFLSSEELFHDRSRMP